MSATAFTASVMLLVTAAGTSTKSTAIDVSVTLLPVCNATTTPLGFGRYANAEVTAPASVVLTCTTGTPYTIALGGGRRTGPSARELSSGTTVLRYFLYKPAGLGGGEWGDAGFGDTYTLGTVVAGLGSGAAQPLEIVGIIPAGQGLLPPGTYVDFVAVTVHY